MAITLFTIGFTESSAEHFFTRLMKAGVRRLIDCRLNNVSQLAGFAKKDDLSYFARTICGIEYVHELSFAPAQEMLKEYRAGKDWPVYEKKFSALIQSRKIETRYTRESLDRACLLCSETSAERCHRKLVAEYFQGLWKDVLIQHLA